MSLVTVFSPNVCVNIVQYTTLYPYHITSIPHYIYTTLHLYHITSIPHYIHTTLHLYHIISMPHYIHTTLYLYHYHPYMYHMLTLIDDVYDFNVIVYYRMKKSRHSLHCLLLDRLVCFILIHML